MRWFSLVGSAARSLRQSPLRTVLSVLGLVIGVASLVAILSMIDGMERYARDQIETTTSMQTVYVSARTSEQVDGVWINREAPPPFTTADVRALHASLGDTAVAMLMQRRAVEVRLDTVRTALQLTAAGAAMDAWSEVEVREGRLFRDGGAAELVVSAPLADRLAPEGGSVMGRTLTVDSVEAVIVGVTKAAADGPNEAYGLYDTFADSEGDAPLLALHVDRAEDVGAVTDRVRSWLDRQFEEGDDAFEVASYEDRAEQFRQAMLLFKLVMGLITGISVVVGGVGVMNVLLMTVTERTQEIGVRKAVGARRRDVVVQFLAEAVAVSGAGSVVGLGVGLAVVFAAAPILRSVTEVPFYAAVTWQTLSVVGVLAVAVGVVFGTYPALRAARLSPVEAIRHE